MQDVHTLSRFGVLPTMAFTRWMFGFQRREVRRCEWEMLLPKPGPLPQTSQLAATVDTPSIGWTMRWGRLDRQAHGHPGCPGQPRKGTRPAGPDANRPLAYGTAMFDAPAVRQWASDALDALARAREEIDALNVFPVPDGDTGTNLYLTLEAALEEVDSRPDDDDLERTVRALAHGALLGARGNSGVILSQFARGGAEALGRVLPVGTTDARPDLLCWALRAAADAGYAAVSAPVEGTMLTVLRVAAETAESTERSGDPRVDVIRLARAAAAGAHAALARTPDQLEALRRAGVVDAGGRGVTVLLDTLVRSVTGEHPVTEPTPLAIPKPLIDDQPSGEAGPPFEVMYLLEADAVDVLKTELAPLGDSLLVVGGDGLWNVHVHVADVGAAVEAGIRAGRPYRIKVTHFAEQLARQAAGREQLTRAVVALAPGQGLADLAESCGAIVVVGRRPSTREIVEAIQSAHAQEVVVLPNHRDTIPVANAAAEYARSAGLRVAVVPSRASVQVLAALAVHDPGRRYEDDVVAMTAAARATRSGAVTQAVRQALTSAGVCEIGDVLGVLDEDVVLIGSDITTTARDLLDRMLMAGGELVTLVTGTEAPPDLVPTLEAYARRAHPEVEVSTYDGGQDGYPLLVGVE